MEAIISITSSNSRKLTAIVSLRNVTFKNNRNANFLKVNSRGNIWEKTVFILMLNVNISLNEHHNNDSLILLSDSIISFSELFFTHNSFYDDLIKLDVYISSTA